MRGLFQVEVQSNQLRVLLNTAKLSLDASQLTQLGLALRDTAARVQARAVRNVSGYPVQYDGRVFRVVVRTGALKGAIEMQWPYQGPLQARVFVNGAHTATFEEGAGFTVRPRPVSDYAAAIEFGHKAIDLKQYMLGKTVPFFASRTKSSTGPYAARGLSPIAGTNERIWENIPLSVKLALQGKKPMQFERRAATSYAKGGAGTYYIAFRKVGKTGWVIPEAKPRPFMRAAVRQSERDARTIVRDHLVELLTNAAHRPHS